METMYFRLVLHYISVTLQGKHEDDIISITYLFEEISVTKLEKDRYKWDTSERVRSSREAGPCICRSWALGSVHGSKSLLSAFKVVFLLPGF